MLTSDAFADLVKRAATRALGGHVIARIADEPTLDAVGEPAVDVLIVLAGDDRGPTGDALLDAMADVSRALHAAGEERTLLISFANESELAERADP